MFIACIPAFAQIPANWNQKFWQFNLTPSNAYVYNSGCTNVSGTPCSGALTNNMSLTHAVAGDVWASAWAADGNIYSCVDDNFGANYSGTFPNGSSGGHNLSIMKVAGNPFDGTLAITDANTMSDYGAMTQTNTNGWTDNNDWKCPGGGMKSITYSGTHYMLEWVERQNNTSPFPQSNTSLISTSDNWAHVSNAYGVTNSTTGAAPASPNSLINTAGFTAPSFVDFGLQDGACPSGVLEDCGNYLYGTAIGHWTGTDTKIYSWRFPIGDVASLSNLSSDLQWFNSAKTGCNKVSTGFPSCWDTIGNATAIYTAPSAILGMVPMTYIASSGKYIMTEFYYLGSATNSTNWPVLECNSVIGPCSLNMQYFTWTGGTPAGCYNAQIDSKHSDFQSRALVLTYACDYGTPLNSPLSTQYTLYYNTAYLPPPRKPIAVSSLNNDRALPANGLKLLYDMIHDYGGLALTDYSGGGNNYTLGSNPTWGTTSRGLAFNGVSGVDIVTPVNISWTALTYGGLVLATGSSPNGYERILDQGGAANGFWLGRNATGANSFECGVKQSSAPYGGTFTLTDGSSHLVLCGWNGTTQSLYISGGSSALGSSSPGSAPIAAGNLYMGGDSGSPLDILKGMEYILPIWNRALLSTEQNRVYKAIYDAAISAGVTP
jgi:hypothetical protein